MVAITLAIFQTDVSYSSVCSSSLGHKTSHIQQVCMVCAHMATYPTSLITEAINKH